MPELPEVEIVRRQLADKIAGKTIAEIEVRSWSSVDNDRWFAKKLTGQKILAISRKGKYLFFTLSGDDSFLICHLRMTGRLIFQTPKGQREYGGGHALDQPKPKQPHEHTRVIFTFSDGSHLYFNDMRRFGYIERASKAEVEAEKEKLGIEPLADDYEREWFKSVFSGRNTSVKALLLKQDDIAGLGNIYVDESLWRAKIKPDRTADDLTDSELEELFTATREVLEDSLELGGTTFRDFADTGGEQGNFTDKLSVFGRQGEPCPRCGTKIAKIKVAGRGTHLCRRCQK